jgi:ribonuclease HI/pterin-4a-carbinolamine dehydratase
MWQEKNNSLYKKFELDTFEEAIQLINKVADLASDLDHHPKIINEYNSVELFLSTHSAGNKVTEKDREFTERLEEILESKEPVSADRIKLFTDGGSRGNPGPSAIGYAIYNGNDQLIKEEGKYIGFTTNNQAEYTGLKEGLLAAKKLGSKNVEVFMDSLLVINQLKGVYRVKNKELCPSYDAVKKLSSDFSKISFTHIPRELNRVADGLVNEALDDQSKLI